MLEICPECLREIESNKSSLRRFKDTDVILHGFKCTCGAQFFTEELVKEETNNSEEEE